MNECLLCQRGRPAETPRVCPECNHVFQGNGWDGIDAHWRAYHEDVMPYKQFWDAMCADHWTGGQHEDSDRETGQLR